MAKLAFAFLEKPTGFAVTTIFLIGALLAYIVPLTLVTVAFIYVGDKVIVHIDQGFTKIERVLDAKQLARIRR